MKIGDVYTWVTDKAKGHASRQKMHVFICAGDWQANGYVFLLINKSDFQGGLRIERDDGFPFLTLDHSFIGVSSIVTYTEEDLRRYDDIRKIGSVPDRHLRRLYASVRDSDFMEDRDIAIVCAALAKFL